MLITSNVHQGGTKFEYIIFHAKKTKEVKKSMASWNISQNEGANRNDNDDYGDKRSARPTTDVMKCVCLFTYLKKIYIISIYIFHFTIFSPIINKNSARPASCVCLACLVRFSLRREIAPKHRKPLNQYSECS